MYYITFISLSRNLMDDIYKIINIVIILLQSYCTYPYIILTDNIHNIQIQFNKFPSHKSQIRSYNIIQYYHYMQQNPSNIQNNQSFHEQNDEYLGIREPIEDCSQNISATVHNRNTKRPTSDNKNQQNQDRSSQPDQQQVKEIENQSHHSDHLDSVNMDKTISKNNQQQQRSSSVRKKESEKSGNWDIDDEKKQNINRSQNKRQGRGGRRNDNSSPKKVQLQEKQSEGNKQLQKSREKDKKDDNWQVVQQEAPTRVKRTPNDTDRIQQQQIQQDKQSNSSWNKEQKNEQQPKKCERGNRRSNNQEERSGRRNNYENNNREEENKDNRMRGNRNGRPRNEGPNSGGYNRGQNNRNRNTRNDQGDLGNQRGFENRKRPYDRNYGGDQMRRDNNLPFFQNNVQNSNKLQHEKSAQNKQKKTDTISIKPSGQRCWPQISIYIKKTKLIFTYREITEHSCDFLLFPFIDLKFNVYPSGLINKFAENYRDKIKQKISSTQHKTAGSDGWVYLKQCNSINNFHVVIFLKISTNPSDNPIFLKKVLNAHQAIKNEKSELTKERYSILIPYSQELGEFKECLESIVEKVEKTDKLDTVIITTNNKQNSINSFNQFNSFIINNIQENMIAI